MIRTPIEHRYEQINGIRMHLAIAGRADAQPLILLHGFPEFWYAWRHQVDALCDANFRLIMPDLRGYNLTEKPPAISDYSLDVLADDVIALADFAGQQKALVIGHDWGGATLWWAANKYPERFAKIAQLNIGHHAAFSRMLETDWGQRFRSFYMLLFQMPYLPETLFRLGNGSLIERMAFGKDHPAFTQEDLAAYRAAWKQEGATRAMTNWYRAVVQARPQPLPSPQIHVPTLLIWGKKDPVMKAEMAQKSIDLCTDGRLHYIEDATHWVAHEAAGEVNQLLIEWFSDN